MKSAIDYKKLFNQGEKFLFIGSAFFISKIVFLIIPYITNSIDYNEFNKIYYSAAIVILFAKLGFDFAINRVHVHHKNLFIAVLINTLIMVIVLKLTEQENYSYINYTSIFLYSFFYIIANIFLMKTLFDGNFKRYFLFKLFYGIILIAIVFILISFHLEIFLVFPIAGILWMIYVYSFSIRDFKGEGKLTDFYKLGFAGFVVNAALGFAFIADKYIVNHFMNLDVANAYTFAWGLTSPMLYLGNMVEHSIYTAGNINKRKIIKNAFILLAGLIVLYSIGIYAVVFFLPNLLPQTINLSLLKQVLILFLLVYSIYSLIQYPLNGILFKFINSSAQYKLAKIYPSIFLFFFACLFYVYKIQNSDDFFLLIALCSVYLFVLLGIKVLIVRKSIA
ncbi:MAG: hypothetical protein WAR79_20745 [Melioribacteraceae bacterium]